MPSYRSSCRARWASASGPSTRSLRQRRTSSHAPTWPRRAAMRIELNEVIWLEAETLSFDELLERSGLPAQLLKELVQAGGIPPLDPSAAQPQYGARALMVARRARRLQQDFELDAAALLLVLDLLDRVAELEGRLNELQVKLPRRAS